MESLSSLVLGCGHCKRPLRIIRFHLLITLPSGCGLALIFKTNTNPGVIVVPLLIMGIGVGCVFQPILVALQAHSSKARRAVIISNRNFNRSAGGACGLAISAAVLQARLKSTLPLEYKALADSTYALPNFKGGTPAGVLDAYMSASHLVFIVQVPLIGVCFLGSLLMKDRGLTRKEDEPVQAPLHRDIQEPNNPVTNPPAEK